MADLQSNIIQSIAKVIESAQSGYAPKGLPARTPVDSLSQTLTLTVVASRQNQLILQAQSSAKRIVLDKQSIEGLNKVNIEIGDKLVLLSNKGATSQFYIEKSFTEANPIKNVARFSSTLAKEWSNISPSLAAKIPPTVLSQTQIPSNTVQSQSLLSSVVDIAQKSGRPLLPISLTATPVFIGLSNNETSLSNAVLLRLNIAVNNKQTSIDLPLLSELKNILSNVKTVALSLNIQNTKQIVDSMGLVNSTNKLTKLNPNILRELNQHLANELNKPNNALLQNLKSLLTSSPSHSLDKGIVIAATPQNINKLGTNIKQQLLAFTSENQSHSYLNERHDAKVLLSSQANSSQILLSLIAKPQLLSLSNAVLNNGLTNASKGGDKSEKLASEQNTVTQAQTNKSTSQIADTAVAKQTDVLKNSVLQLLLRQGHSSDSAKQTIQLLSAVIAKDLNQALPHAQDLGKSIQSLHQLLTSLTGKAQGETQLFLQKIIQSLGLDNANIDEQIEHLSKQSQKGNLRSGKTNDLLSTTTSASSIPKLVTNADSEAKSNISKSTTVSEPLGADLIKQEFIASSLPDISQNVKPISQIGGQSGLVNGLVTMLQASLYAKLMQQQPALSQHIVDHSKLSNLLAATSPSILSSTLNTSKANQKSNISRVLQDIGKLDPSGNLIEELNKVLSKHSLHKLASAEASLQGNDSFYYSLPNMFSPAHKDTEILITREQERHAEKDDKSIQTTWQLSMKLDIGESGEVLAKVKLVKENLSLNLYASNIELKNKVLDYIPYLNRRLTQLGLSVEHKCYVGKIPETLHKTDFQVVQAYV